MENFALIALARALGKAAEGMVVRRIVQHHARGFLLQARSARIPGLKILMNPASPMVYVSGTCPPVSAVTSEFLMVLRKHLNGARLVETLKPARERIVELTFKTTLPARELESVRLVLELFPNSPNLFLLDAGDRVLAALSPPHAKRGLRQYEAYRYPANGDGTRANSELDTEDIDFDEKAFLASPDYLVRTVPGTGPILAREIAHRCSAQDRGPLELLAEIMDGLDAPGPTAWVYTAAPLSEILRANDLAMLGRAVISPIELTSLRTSHSAQTYPGILEATRAVADEIESRTLLARAKTPLLRDIRRRKRKVETRRDRLTERERRFDKALELRKTAQLLAASGQDMDRRLETIQVRDYFTEDAGKREVRLDASKTLRENIDRMFKEYRKAERGLKMVGRQLKDAEAMRRRLEDQERRVEAIGDWNAWQARGGSTMRPEAEPARHSREKPSRRRRSGIWIDGHEVLFGRNGRENDELTFHVASADDFWLHVADYTGAHVIVRNPERADTLDSIVLERAAQLAAYHSQARNSGKVDVHYTRRKFVTKPRNAKPGLVRLREFETVTVEPRDWKAPESRSGDAIDETSLKT
jgi:predicted ribosome quality control (RQC) complex YloA/Tae2 family protein